MPTGVTVWRDTFERFQAWQARAQVRQSFKSWPHEALGDELSRCPNPVVAEGVQGVEYLETEVSRDVWARFARRGMAVQLD